jgi:hypothetical protein
MLLSLVSQFRSFTTLEAEDMQELLPVALGLLLGATLGFVAPRARTLIGATLAVALGVLVTVITGEAQLSWGYVLVDIPLVAAAAVLSLMVVRRLHLRHRPS